MTEYLKLYTEGSLDSTIAFVGEAPGAVEERSGKPFIGPSGQLLDQLLLASMISRKSVYITNVIKTKPPGNDASIYVIPGRKKQRCTRSIFRA